MDENEKTLLLDRTYECPICDHKIKAKSVKTSVAKFVETKADLRPIYSNINVTKYDTVCCNYCGYAAFFHLKAQPNRHTDLTQSAPDGAQPCLFCNTAYVPDWPKNPWLLS